LTECSIEPTKTSRAYLSDRPSIQLALESNEFALVVIEQTPSLPLRNEAKNSQKARVSKDFSVEGENP